MTASGQGWIGISSPVAIGVGCEVGEGNKITRTTPAHQPPIGIGNEPDQRARQLVASYPLSFSSSSSSVASSTKLSWLAAVSPGLKGE